jgi:hypothetical protein
MLLKHLLLQSSEQKYLCNKTEWKHNQVLFRSYFNEWTVFDNFNCFVNSMTLSGVRSDHKQTPLNYDTTHHTANKVTDFCLQEAKDAF